MNKSILVIDTPNSCSECELCNKEADTLWCLALYNSKFDDNVTNGKSQFCPLQDTTELLKEIKYALQDNREYLYESLLNKLYKALDWNDDHV